MGFTNVAWESRDTEQLARDLTDGPGPKSVGQAGAAWVRVANELVDVYEEYQKVLDQLRSSFTSQSADAVATKLDEFGMWIQAAGLSAAGNGERAEEAAVANGAAVLAMPSVSEAVEARMSRDVMDSLAAYNGAILNGRFAELDDAASADQANASVVMYQYEESCQAMAAPWEQPLPPDVCNDAALNAQRDATPAEEQGGAGGGGSGGAGVAPPPLTPFQARGVKPSNDPKVLTQVGGNGNPSGGAGGMGSGYGPMAGLARGAGTDREHESSLPARTLDGSGEPGAGVSATGGSWLPVTQPNDAPFTVSAASWGPNTSVFDELAMPDEAQPPSYADEPERTLEQVSSSWAAPPVLGADRSLSI